ncbi:MAG TPA: phospho-sugar mutase [Acidimicrobiales bacterium]
MRDDLIAAARAWMAEDPDPVTRAELQGLLDSGDEGAVAERFAGRLQFGTAGLRGELGAGPMRMNRVIVRRAAAGLSRYLLDEVDGAAERGVVVGRDARTNSDVFAEDTARLCAAAGLRTFVMPGPLPTPVLAFAVTHLRAAAGVMVTASHNPPRDNGYKVYLDAGNQIVSPVDVEISRCIDAVGPLSEVPMAEPDDSRIVRLGDEIVEAYLDHVPSVRLVPDATDVKVAYTAMHGVGRDTLVAAFDRAGFPPPAQVTSQVEPDPAFPTVSFPNPEEPGAMDRLLALAAEVDADLAIANDPDADRLGAAVKLPDGTWRPLKGDEIGWLLGDHILRHTSGDDRLVVTTLVSSTLLGRMAAAAGVSYAETFTGFKWIARTVLDRPEKRFLFGYEQALGYLVTNRPLDKDGVTAAVVLAEAAAVAKREGLTLLDRLADLERRFGRHVTAERSLRIDPADAPALIAALRADPPAVIGGWAVTDVVDFPEADLLRFECGEARVQVRPSGTEPKVKIYAEAVGADPTPMLDSIASRLMPG